MNASRGARAVMLTAQGRAVGSGWPRTYMRRTGTGSRLNGHGPPPTESCFLPPRGATWCTLRPPVPSFVRRAFPLLTDDGLLLVEDGSTLAGGPRYPPIRLWPRGLAALATRGRQRRPGAPPGG